MGHAPGVRLIEPGADLTFLAPPGEVADWRLVITAAAAGEAGLLDALPGTADELAERLGLHPRSVRVVLDALGAWSVVARDGGGRYSLGPSAPDADQAASLWYHARAISGWTRLADALHDPARPRPPGDAMSPDRFQSALAVVARRRAGGLVDAILARVGRVGSVLDLGGGHGEYALEFSRRGVEAVLQDRPPVIDAARRRGAVTADGVELFEGDFFETLPPRAFDLVLVAGVTHTFDADHNRLLYERVREVLRPGGVLVISTMLQRRTEIAALFAVQMLVNGTGGDTHAEEDYRRWLAGAGYRKIEVVDIAGARPQSIVIARRPGQRAP